MSQSTHTLAITMTADMGAAIVALNNSEQRIRELVQAKRALGSMTPELTAAIDEEILALKREQLALGKRAGLVDQNAQINKNFSKSIAQVGAGSGKFNQAIGQAAFAVEDFMSVIETMGFKGAMRAAGNNLSMIGHILGGPLVGGAVGFAAVAGPMLISKLFEVGQTSKEVARDILTLAAEMESLADQEVKNLKFRFELVDVNEMGIDQLDAQMKSLPRAAEEHRTRLKNIQKEQDALGKQLAEQLKLFEKPTSWEIAMNLVLNPGSLLAPLFLNDVGASSETMKEAFKKFREIREKTREALAISPHDAIAIMETYKSTVENIKSTLLPMEARNIEVAFSADKSKLDDVLKLGGSLEEVRKKLEGLAKAESKERDDLNKNMEKTLEILEQQLQLRERISRMDMEEADKVSWELGRSGPEKKLLDDLMDKERSLTEQFEASKGSPEDLKNYRERLAEIQNEKVEALTDMLGKNTDVVKDATISASNQAEAARAAVMQAEKQSREGSAKKEEIPRAEIVNALKNVEKAIKSGQTLVLQSGGSI
jgi:DNA repair exonuclease SbcCD ATPase subunit